jgi:hypothetical protein
MATFLTGIVSGVLVIWPIIFYTQFHSDTIISKTSNAAFLSWLIGFILAICGLLIPKESRKELYYSGKTICAAVVVFESVGALLMMRSCVEGLQNIH